MGRSELSWALTITTGEDYFQAPTGVRCTPFVALAATRFFLPAGMVSSSAGDGISPLPAGQWVVIICSERRFGFPLERVSEILTPRVLTRLPGTGPEVCGLAGVHGKVVTVLDLGVLLGLRAAGMYTDHRLLLLDLDRRQVGVVVEAVAAITAARVEPGEAMQLGTAVLGVGLTEEGEFTALEPERLLRELLQ